MSSEMKAEALSFLKEKFMISRLRADGIHRAEAMYLLPPAYSFEHCSSYKIVATTLVVDEMNRSIDVLENTEYSAFEAILERCKVSNVYVLHGRRETGSKELILNKGTTVEQLLIEKELSMRGKL